jgi:hypothetical protein
MLQRLVGQNGYVSRSREYDITIRESLNMRRAYLSAAAVCVLLAAAFSIARAQNPREAAVKAAPSWEYRIIMLPDMINNQDLARQEGGKPSTALEPKFNELGRDGWEFCEHINTMVVFKRPRP